MIQKKRTAVAAFALLALTAIPAAAQDRLSRESVFDGDYLTIGAGLAVAPSYEGSDDYRLFPAPAFAGRIGGVGITPRPAGFALDFIKDPKDAKFSFQLGPVLRVRFDRNRGIEDDVVWALGKKKVAWEVGGNAGFSINRITNPYDSLTFSVDVRGDVGSAHKGVIVTPNISFNTPLSKASFVAINVSADHVDGKFARYYYSVTPEGNQASGLPIYDAQSGWKNASVNLLGSLDLDGDLTNGGFALFAGGGYSRMLGNFRRAPVVDLRGSPNQWTGAIGIGYTF